MNILNARLRGRSGLYRIELDGARIAAISAAGAGRSQRGRYRRRQQSGGAALYRTAHPPDATLTAGEPAGT